MKLSIIVVLYNKKLESSEACSSLNSQTDRDFSVTVYDNSTDNDIASTNGETCVQYEWRYLGGKGNVGLSAAYNAVIRLLLEKECPDFIMLLDDDTSFDSGMIASVKNCIACNPKADVLLPIVKEQGSILSPWRETAARRTRFFKTEEECLNCEISGILAFNSGMTVSSAVFRNTCYDERLFLDGIDIAFLSEVKSLGKQLQIMPVVLEQRFSGREKHSLGEELTRFSIYSSDMLTMFGKNSLTRFFLVNKRALHLSLQHRSLRFFERKRNEREERK